MFHWLNHNGNGSAQKGAASHNPTSLPLATTITNLTPGASTPATEVSPALGTPPTARRSVGWASNLFKPSNSKPQNSNLKLGPSGAIVFKPFESQESIVSTLPPASDILSERVGNAYVPSIEPTLVRSKHRSTGQLRPSSPESSRSVAASLPRRRSSENYQPRLSNFLGRHPPPIQRRSTSLPPTLLSRIPERVRSPTPERELLFIGGHTEPPSPKFTKIPRFVPLEIRRTNVNMPHCVADCTSSVEKEGDFCPEHEDQFSTTGTWGSIMRSTIGDYDGRHRPPTTSAKNLETEKMLAEKSQKGPSPGFMAKFKGVFGGKSKDEGKEATNEKK